MRGELSLRVPLRRLTSHVQFHGSFPRAMDKLGPYLLPRAMFMRLALVGNSFSSVFTQWAPSRRDLLPKRRGADGGR